MALGAWLFAIFIFVVVLVLAIGLGLYYRNRNVPNPEIPTPLFSTWLPPQPGPDPDKNTCQLYQFSTGIINVGSVPTVTPPNPTLNPDTLDNLIGSPNIPDCLDSDRLVAQQVTRTCGFPPTPQRVIRTDLISRCRRLDGSVARTDETEVVYTAQSDPNRNGSCTNLPRCAGQISLVSVNANPLPPTFPRCMSNPSDGTPLVMIDCDPQDFSQLFRVTRVNFNQNPNTVVPITDPQTGALARIFNRDTGTCLKVDQPLLTQTYLYDEAFAGCGTGLIPINSYYNVSFGECEATGNFEQRNNPIPRYLYPGYNWYLHPGFVGCLRTPAEGGCTSATISHVPPQLLYLGDVNMEEFPNPILPYRGLEGLAGLTRWFIDQETPSLFYGGIEGQKLIAFPNVVQSEGELSCLARGAVAQYVNLTIFNSIIRQEVCIPGQIQAPGCVPLNSST